MVEDLTPAQRKNRYALRRMKLVAVGALVLAAVVYTVTQLVGPAGWLGYVHAAAEASMVGALADWFAVTALFRRPLGLPIPHTALIPTRKDQLGDSLGDFVGTNFLAEDVVRDKLRRAGLARRGGEWLSGHDNAERVTAELAALLRGVVTVLRDEDVQAVLEQVLVKRLVDRPWGPPLGRVLHRVFSDGSHHKLVDLLTDRAYEWVRDNHSTVLRVVSDRAPSWSPRFVDEMFADRLYGEVLAFAWAVKTDVNHPMRMALDGFLVRFSEDLQSDPDTMARADAVKQQVLDNAEVQGFIGSAWGTAKTMLLDAADDPSSELRRRTRDGVISFGKRLGDDEELRGKVDGWIEKAAAYVVSHYAPEITTLITDTVSRWDTGEASRKIELAVGKDLQYIRLNGTVVGALAGLLIYALTQLL